MTILQELRQEVEDRDYRNPILNILMSYTTVHYLLSRRPDLKTLSFRYVMEVSVWIHGDRRFIFNKEMPHLNHLSEPFRR